MNQNHSFNTHLATRIGIEKAILLKNIAYWVENNKYQNKNFFDDKYWTYNSSVNYAKQFPYMKASSIRRWMTELEAQGWIITGNFNSSGFNQTKWYTIGITYYWWMVEFADFVKNEAKEVLDSGFGQTNNHGRSGKKEAPAKDHFKPHIE